MLASRRSRPCAVIDFGPLHPPAESVRWNAELLPDPCAHAAPTTCLVARIEHEVNRSQSQLVGIPALYCFRGIKNLH
jgi:hypothetical protein